MGLFSSKKSSSTNNATTNTAGINDTGGGHAIALNGSGNNVQMLDGGAIAGAFGFANNAGREAFNFADNALEKTAGLTLDLVKAQASSASAAMDFAMDAGRSDVKVLQDTGKLAFYLAALVAGAFVLVKWGAK